jgi:sortase B
MAERAERQRLREFYYPLIEAAETGNIGGMHAFLNEHGDNLPPPPYGMLENVLTSAIKEKNNDVYGWIRCKGGMPKINYPIIKGDNNNFYLTMNVNKEYTREGSIFADFRNSFKQSDNYNTIFYGHNMSNGDMFGGISEWYNSKTRDETADQMTIEIITPDAVYVYEIFAAYRSTGADFITVSFANNSAYMSFLNSIQKKSVLNRDIPYDANSRIITLSTCTNVREDERYVVHGILTKIIKYS